MWWHDLDTLYLFKIFKMNSFPIYCIMVVFKFQPAQLVQVSRWFGGNSYLPNPNEAKYISLLFGLYGEMVIQIRTGLDAIVTARSGGNKTTLPLAEF